MRKKRLLSITVLLTTLFLCSVFFAGCSGSAQTNNSNKNDVVPFAANESKETLASQPNLIDKLATAAVIGNTGSVESDVIDEHVDDNEEYYDDSSEDYDDSDYSEEVEEQEEYDEPPVEEPAYEEPEYDEVVEDASAYEDENVEEYYEEEYYEDSYEENYSDTEYVWIPEHGHKYHNKPDCGNMNPNTATEVTREQAEAEGYGACKKCFG